MFENAKWIAADPNRQWRFLPQNEMPPAPYIVKDFCVKSDVKSVKVNIVALGQGAFFVNGVRIPDSYLPTYNSSLYKSVYYNTYDVTSMIKEGKNRFGVILAGTRYNDTSTPLFRSANSVMIAHLVIEYADGSAEDVLTDSSWRWYPSPTLASRRRIGEVYDARLAVKDWCKAETDISHWGNVTVWMGAGGKLEPIMCPPQRNKAVLKGKEVAKGVFDFGINTSGWARIFVSGKRGETLTVRYAELLSEDGLHIDQSSVYEYFIPDSVHIDKYTLSGEGNEEWEQYFVYHGFRYVEVEGNYDSLSVEAVVVYTDMPVTASFDCDNEVIKKIYDACNNSILTCCHNSFVDCPHREQNEWSGDALFGCEPITMGFDSYSTIFNWIKVFKDEQRSDGQLPCIIPSDTGGWNNNFARGIDWDSAIIHLPYYAYKYTGNREIVDFIWDNMVKSMSFFYDMSENYITEFGLGDWMNAEGERCDIRFTSTAMFYIDAVLMSEMAKATNRDFKPFEKLAQNIKNSFRNLYVKDSLVTVNHETAICTAIYAGLLTEEESKAEAFRLNAILKENGCFKGGIYEIRMIFDVLTKYGYAQTLFDILVDKTKHGFAKMVETGNCTIAEGMKSKYSRNHYFMCQPAAWCLKSLAGVNLDGFGFENVKIKPVFVDGINEVKAEVFGIKVAYDKENLSVDSPYDFTLYLNDEIKKIKAGNHTFKR